MADGRVAGEKKRCVIRYGRYTIILWTEIRYGRYTIILWNDKVLSIVIVIIIPITCTMLASSITEIQKYDLVRRLNPFIYI